MGLRIPWETILWAYLWGHFQGGSLRCEDSLWAAPSYDLKSLTEQTRESEWNINIHSISASCQGIKSARLPDPCPTLGGMLTAILFLPWWTARLKLWAGMQSFFLKLLFLGCVYDSGGGCICQSNDKITRTPHAVAHFPVRLCNISHLFLISNAHNLSSLGNGQHQNLLLLKLLPIVVMLNFENLWEIWDYLLIRPLSCFPMSLQRQASFFWLCSTVI